MKKAAKKTMKMSASNMKADKAKGAAKDMKAMSPQEKFKAMIMAKKDKASKKLSYGKSAGKKGAMKMSMSKKPGKK